MTDEELAQLDLAVAKAENIDVRPEKGWEYRPTRDPAEAMRLLTKYRLSLEWAKDMVMVDHGDIPYQGFFHSLPEAICRAVVALHEQRQQEQ